MTAALWSPELALAEATRARDRGWRPFPVDHPAEHGDALNSRGEPTGCTGAHRRPDWPRGMPCDGKRGKHPVVRYKNSAATNVPPTDELLRQWFGGPPRRRFNVGIACGPSRLLVVDSDQPGAFERMCAELGHPVPDTYRVRTASDWHWYFDATAHPELGNKEGLLAEYGINARGKGGYVVGPGSLHASGHIYVAFDPDAPTLPVPDWLADAIATRPDDDKRERADYDGDQDDPRFIDREQALIEFYEAVQRIQHKGNTFRQEELFPAALDGWRCVDNGWLTEREMKLALRDAVRRVWDNDPDPRDIQIINVEARDRALRSPWLPHDAMVIGEAPVPPPAAPINGATNGKRQEDSSALSTAVQLDVRVSAPTIVDDPADGDTGADTGADGAPQEGAAPQEIGSAPDPLTSADPGTGADPLDALVDIAYGRLKARRIAQRRLDAEEAGDPAPPSSVALVDLLAEEDTDPQYLIDRVWPLGGKVILSAQQKAGKTTMVGNLVRALVDGDPLLGARRASAAALEVVGAHGGFAVTPLADHETVFVFDFELDRRMIRRWLREHRIRNPHRVHIEAFRGKVWDPRDEKVRAAWARHLRERNVRVVVLDPLAPVLSALGIEEIDNTGVGQFLHAMDALVLEAGAQELLITHHTTHDGERGRGASVLRGWPDAEWRFVVERPEHGGEPEPNATRFFAATGRDVAEPERALEFDVTTRTLTIKGGNRVTHAVDKHAAALVEVVRSNPGLNKRDLREALLARVALRKETADKVIAAAERAGLIHVHEGARASRLHHPGAPGPECVACVDEGRYEWVPGGSGDGDPGGSGTGAEGASEGP